MGSLRVEGISKRFGSVQALTDVSTEFLPGEIHAVLGENGAGKSTLVGVLSGFIVPDTGRITLGGEDLPMGRPFDSKRRGIEMIHQHFTLVPDFTVAENLALSCINGLACRADASKLSAKAVSLANELGWVIQPETRVRSLPVGVQQRVEILKALNPETKAILFDEPTAVLSAAEVADLFTLMRRLKDDGKIVVLIAHKLSEIMSIADKVTILRRGRKVGEGPLGSFTEQSLAELMVGEMPVASSRGEDHGRAPGLSVAYLRVLGDRGEEAVRGISFSVQRHEIFGIGGVDGNGQVELAEALACVRRVESGKILWEGTGFSDQLRIGYIPQDRQTDGLAMGMSVQDNLLITGHRRSSLGKGMFLNRSKISSWAKDLIERYDIKVRDSSEKISSLSGGNQQKVVVSRTLDGGSDLLVVVNPTRGLDIRATQFVHDALRQARDDGAAVVLLSTDLDELAAIADRKVFINRGELREAAGATTLVGGG